MKKLFLYLTMVVAIFITSCKGNTKKDSKPADSGQTHVSTESPTDTAGLPTSPVETGGQDTSGNGAGNTNAPKDTLKTKPD